MTCDFLGDVNLGGEALVRDTGYAGLLLSWLQYAKMTGVQRRRAGAGKITIIERFQHFRADERSTSWEMDMNVLSVFRCRCRGRREIVGCCSVNQIKGPRQHPAEALSFTPRWICRLGTLHPLAWVDRWDPRGGSVEVEGQGEALGVIDGS